MRAVIALLAVIAFSGCVTASRDPLVVRKKAYERLASFLEPGMTRRQVYALLPPHRTPTTTAIDPWSYTFAMLGPSGFQSETHPLDPDFHLSVQYILARQKDDKAPGRNLARRSDRLAISARSIDVCYDARGPIPSFGTSQNAIDELLSGVSQRQIVRSKEDTDDILYVRPTVLRSFPSRHALSSAKGKRSSHVNKGDPRPGKLDPKLKPGDHIYAP